jgi:hypothetical protein
MLPDLRVALQANLLEYGQDEVRRIPLPRTWVNSALEAAPIGE